LETLESIGPNEARQQQEEQNRDENYENNLRTQTN
jgi:hypothetical protein